MSQQFGPPNYSRRSTDIQPPRMTSGMRPLPPPSSDQALFHIDVPRSLQLHWRLARNVVLAFLVLAIFYVIAQVMVFKSWPTYKSESIVYVQPTPAKVLPNSGGAPRWPFDSNTYETYIQQQMMNVSREDVLIAAVHKMDRFQGPGESDQSAAQRLVQSLEVTRAGDAYQFSISARARDANTAAEIANAVTAAYIESASRDERTGDAQRVTMLKEEKDRIQTALAADRAEQDDLNKQLGVASVGAAVPDHYDDDITQIRTELVKARTDHDAAEARFTALGAGAGPSSSAIDAEADEMIATDAGLVSMKTALNSRRATIISQMSNLTPVNPQYKQDEAELTKINATLDSMMKDLRAKAAARIQLQLRSDLQRTGGVEAQLNGQLRQLVGSATSATPKLQRSSDLASDITRLQARYATVDEQLHDLLLEDNAPAAAYQVTPAVPPMGRSKSGVMRNAIMIAFAGLFFALLAAVVAQKLDPRVYIASDVEQVLGFAPLAQLPNFNEVSEGVAEEYMLRLASAIEHARKQGSLKNCIFTGTSPGTGVSTLLNRMRGMLQAMGRPTVLVDATGSQASAPGVTGQESHAPGLVPVQRVSRPTALLQQMEEETETEEDSLVLTDTAPLAVSAETEYLARFVDCAIVVVESGVTTRAELRQTASALQRLNVASVGFVLNRVGLGKADPAFRQSVEAVEKHVQAQTRNVTRRTVPATPPPAPVQEPAPKAAPARSFFEPEVAAAAAAVARFSAHPAPQPVPAQDVCVSAPAAPPPISERARSVSIPIAPEPAAVTPAAPRTSAPQPEPEAAPVTAPVAAPPVEPVVVAAAPTVTAPFAQAAEHFASPAPATAGVPFYPRPVAVEPPAEPAAPVVEESVAVAAAPEPVAPAAEPEPVQPAPQPVAEQPAAPASDLPWWLSEEARNPEPVRPPVLWQPAKVWTARRESPAEQQESPFRETAPAQPSENAPGAQPAPQAAASQPLEEQPANLTSRLSGLRNLLFVLGVKDGSKPDDAGDYGADNGSHFDLRTERAIAQGPMGAPGGMQGASPRLVTATPEFLPPKPVVIEIDNPNPHVGESSTRQDRRASFDGVEVLPSRHGQYRKV